MKTRKDSDHIVDTNEMVQHTPTPWHVGEYSPKPETAVMPMGIVGIGNGSMAIARSMHTGLITRQEAEANAAFIVRAVNCHEEMLQALKDVLFRLEDESRKGNYIDSPTRDMSLEGQVAQAIAKAEGGK